MARPTRFEAMCLAVVALGLFARVGEALALRNLSLDVAWYETMGESLRRSGEFFRPWDGAHVFAQMYPPAYPALLAATFALAGHASYALTQATSLACGAFLVAVVYFTTRDLYGRSAAAASAAIAACFPLFIQFDYQGYTESLVAAFFALTIWAILKSLDDSRWIILAGLVAGLGFLTKSSMGYFFVVAGFAGLAWRFAYMRWRVFRDGHYLTAAALFLAIVVLWSARNVARFGWPHWETQKHASQALAAMWTAPGFAGALVGEFVWTFFLLFALATPWIREIRRAAESWRDERTSALLMAIVTPTVIAVFFVTAFYLAEDFGSIATTLNKRYLVTSLAPILWLAYRDASFERPAATSRPERALALVGIGILALAFAFDPTQLALTLPRIWAWFAEVALGLALVAASTFFWIEQRARATDAGQRLRVRRVSGASALAPAAAFAAVGFVVGTFVALSLVPFFAAAAVAFLVRDPRVRVAGIAVMLLATALVGGAPHAPTEEVTRDVDAHAAIGASLATDAGNEPYFWPTLRDDIAMTTLARDANPDWRIAFFPDPNASPPAGYTLAKSYASPTDYAAGTLAWRWIEEHALGGAPPDAPGVGARLYCRTGVAGCAPL
ncbi:MAG: ArnT family glycosyltransferase [Thermoplasmatota archaeon]